MTSFSRDVNVKGRAWAYVEGSLDNQSGSLTGFVRRYTNSATQGAPIKSLLIFYNSRGDNIFSAELPQCGGKGKREAGYTDNNSHLCRFNDYVPPDIAMATTKINVEVFAENSDLVVHVAKPLFEL